MKKQTKNTSSARKLAKKQSSERVRKSSHGGARKGAGRKPAEDKRKKYSLLLSDAEKSKLDAMCGNLTPSAFIRQKLGL